MQYISPAEVLGRQIECREISLARLKRICFAAENRMAESEIEKRLEYLADWVEAELRESRCGGRLRQYHEKQTASISFFDMAECFVGEVLTFSGGEVVYRYKFMESWHSLSARVGEDLFVANAYALYDFKFGIQRDSFCWKEVLAHDNYSVNNILKKGISDNHYHLRGSIPYFDLSWISLMNSVIQPDVIRRFENMEKNPRDVRMRYMTEKQNEKFEILHIQAALIRVFLYATLTDQLIQLSDYNVSIIWLLEHIVDSENVNRYLNRIDWYCSFLDNPTISIEDYLERELQRMTADGRSGMMEELKINCPGFYWFFWNCFPKIPMEVLVNRNVFLCTENVEAISRYVEEIYAELPLRNCRWLFQGKDYEEYRIEWKYQTKKELDRLLLDTNRLIASRKYIQSILTGLQNAGRNQYKDYILAQTASGNQVNSVISGERWLLYKMYYNQYQSLRPELENWDELYNLLFAYLLIKEQFRMELLYNNGKIGFQNFHTYQGRKTWFTTRFSEGELAKIAVRNAFYDAKLKSLELRIMPCDTYVKNIETIRKYDMAIQDGWKKKYFKKYYYVFHFGKQKDKEIFREDIPICRHEQFRKNLRKKTNAILWMRERDRETGRRILGIDACSSEDGCRPEVFAVAFRVLKNHIVEGSPFEDKVPQLRLSYHVGEENQDVLDGIRAIDEAMFFLNMGSGDRLGHATMLGVDAVEWYYKNDYTISIRQQDYLDNVAWLYQRMVNYHLPNEDNLLEYLEREFHTYFELIYREALEQEYVQLESKDFDIHNYYASWELRGDDPKLYETGCYDPPVHYASIWDDYSRNKKVPKEKREMEKVVAIYHAYHYSPLVREKGNKSIVVKIPLHMVRGIQGTQKMLMREIVQKGIFIETNPTSNVLIGGLDGYGNHPIVNFYNKGLTNRQEELDGCFQINVSINTDDLGVFMTSLSNEYSLMAKSLESMSDRNGNRIYKKDMVYDWLDQIRRMGNEQSFREKKSDKNDEMGG